MTFQLIAFASGVAARGHADVSTSSSLVDQLVLSFQGAPGRAVFAVFERDYRRPGGWRRVSGDLHDSPLAGLLTLPVRELADGLAHGDSGAAWAQIIATWPTNEGQPLTSFEPWFAATRAAAGLFAVWVNASTTQNDRNEGEL
jgi:hypothetical protein